MAATDIGPRSFCEKVSALLNRVEYRRAATPADLETIFRLRYDANLREQTIAPLPERRLTDRFDDGANVQNFGVCIDGILTSALRLHVVSRENLWSPAYDAFGDLLHERLMDGARLIDGNRFVADYPRARGFPQLPYVTLRLGIMAADYFGADLIAASVRSEHAAFYQREYRAQKMCEPRPYPSLIKPLSLILIDYRTHREDILARHPFYVSTPHERRALFQVGALEDA
jgi:hypothetical protein